MEIHQLEGKEYAGVVWSRGRTMSRVITLTPMRRSSLYHIHGKSSQVVTKVCCNRQ